MASDELRELFEEKLKPVREKLDALDAGFHRRERERFVLLSLCGLCLLIAAFSVGFGINRGQALDDQIEANQQSICSQVRSTAVSYRQALPGETQRSFIDRLLAQRATLLNVGDLNCSAIPGFASFPYLRGRALDEIERIIRELAPKRLPRPERTRIEASRDDTIIPAAALPPAPPAAGPVASVPGDGTGYSPPDSGGVGRGDQGDDDSHPPPAGSSPPSSPPPISTPSPSSPPASPPPATTPPPAPPADPGGPGIGRTVVCNVLRVVGVVCR